MYQSQRRFGRAERLTQYAIEIFDLVDIVPAAGAERSIRRRLPRPNAASAARYGEPQSVSSQVGIGLRGK